MECLNCGAPRPPTGRCPNCGALPPRSSRGDWRQQSGRGSAAGRGNSGANWGGRGGWDQQEDDYEEVELGRALVPSRAVMPPDFNVGAVGMPAVPTEDEERLLGIRRPVYIPASDGRRRLRVGSWRVVSGILGIIVVCIAACGAASVFGRHYLEAANNKIKNYSGTRASNYSLVPATPVATPSGPNAHFITDLTTASRIYTDPSTHQDIARDVTTHFLVNDTVYAVGQVRSAPSGQHEVCAGWYIDGTFLPQLRRDHVCTTIDGTASPSYSLKFQLPYPQPGVGMLRIYWDRTAANWNVADPQGKDPALAQTILFGVYLPATPTSPPGSPTPTKVAPSPSPTKSASIAEPVALWREPDLPA
jgi:hypothetical protein